MMSVLDCHGKEMIHSLLGRGMYRGMGERDWVPDSVEKSGEGCYVKGRVCWIIMERR